jgi:glycosyltransferase involved in cell wall biosynthesis
MKTLIISPYSPYPLVFGGAIRAYHVIKMFANLSEVTLLTYAEDVDPREVSEHMRTICEEVQIIADPPNGSSRKGLLQAQATLSTRPFQYYAFYTKRFQDALDKILSRKSFDMIVLEQSQMAYFDLRQSKAMRILDLHNIEYELLARRVPVQRNPVKRAALALEANKFRRDEQRFYRESDLIFTASDRERDQLRKLPGIARVETLPNSINCDYFALRKDEPTTNEITFVGTTHVDANRDGLIYFMDEVFPHIEKAVPDIHFTIVGGDPPPVIKAYGERPNVTVTGFVDDVRPYMARARVMVVPLRSGGGTRLKILEGLSYGVPTVSTSIGAEGIFVTHGGDILLADTSKDFAASVIRLLGDPALRRQLALRGRELVEEQYSWQAVGRTLAGYLDSMGKHVSRASLAPASAD